MQTPKPWDAVAPTYAEDVGQWTAYAEEALRVVPVATDARVLDVACGPGTLAFLAARRGARVDAVDFSPGMIEQLRARAAREDMHNIQASVMDAQALTYADGSYDAAFCLFAFFFFPDRARAFGELFRVLRPGGRALIATWAPIERRPVMRIMFEAVAEALPDLPRPTKGDLQDPSECIAEMGAAGFQDVTAHTFTASMGFDSPEHYVELMVRSAAPFVLLRAKLGEGAWHEAMQKVTGAVRRRFPSGAELTAEAIITTGSRPA
jgi:ubiquinone/menaquinone biosynthesis C-methylase UbiE